jgi:ankyrin repeat protein
VRALADAGAKIEHESVTSATPLSRAIESSATDMVEYFIGKRANVRHENLTRKWFDFSLVSFHRFDSIVERNLLDLASDFASPEVFNMVRTAYEQKTTKKGNQPPRKRRPPPPANKKKSKPTDGVNHYTKCQSG